MLIKFGCVILHYHIISFSVLLISFIKHRTAANLIIKCSFIHILYLFVIKLGVDLYDICYITLKKHKHNNTPECLTFFKRWLVKSCTKCFMVATARFKYFIPSCCTSQAVASRRPFQFQIVDVGYKTFVGCCAI